MQIEVVVSIQSTALSLLQVALLPSKSCHAGILSFCTFYRKIPVRDAAFAICGKHMADIVRAPGTSFRDSRSATAALMTLAARWEFSFR